MSEEGKVLASLIKGVHKRLREELKKTGDVETVWSEHCSNDNSLKQYARAMHHLATQHWEKLSSTSPTTSRINWTRDFLMYYFYGGALVREKSMSPLIREIAEGLCKIKVLDVGSCYNPLKVFKEFDVLGLDLCPAVDSVYQCDFLHIPIEDKTVVEHQTVLSLKSASFHCVLFSFLLEYFPSASQRLKCCEKAKQLLIEDGILIIITPDSKAAHSNSKVMKSWKEALALIGLKRIKYEKLQHAHCMAFRNTSVEKLTYDRELLASMIFIPQDLQEFQEVDQDKTKYERYTEEELAEGFSYLPSFH